MTPKTETRLSEAAFLIVQCAGKIGAKSIKDLPGAWFCQINEKWAVAANGKETPQHVGPKDGMDIELTPYHFAVWRNGWLFALMTPFSGQFMGENGEGEDEFISEMRKHL